VTVICRHRLKTTMNVKGRTYTYVVNKAEEGGFVAKCIELPQVHTEGETLAEVKKNMRDALTLAVDYLRERAKREKGEVLEITIR
jgi:predicted RNase H-like HicB family nuclease